VLPKASCRELFYEYYKGPKDDGAVALEKVVDCDTTFFVVLFVIFLLLWQENFGLSFVCSVYLKLCLAPNWHRITLPPYDLIV
jgi:hypothetical protein